MVIFLAMNPSVRGTNKALELAFLWNTYSSSDEPLDTPTIKELASITPSLVILARWA